MKKSIWYNKKKRARLKALKKCFITIGLLSPVLFAISVLAY